MFVGQNLVLWGSKKQQVVALKTQKQIKITFFVKMIGPLS
jgi:hypothetical protein